jgi:hypothetical protein
MKIIIFLLPFCMLSSLLYAQDFTTSKNVLLDMRSGSSAAVLLNALDDYEPETEREKRLYNRNIDSLRVMMQHFAWEVYQAELNERKKFNLPEKEALRGHVQYATDGFPSILIPKTVVKKLAKNGYDADYYFSLGVDVTHRASLGGLSSNVKPIINCDIKVFSPERDIVAKVDYRYKSETSIRSWDFPANSFDKLAFDHIMILADKLKPLVRQAVIEVVSQL